MDNGRVGGRMILVVVAGATAVALVVGLTFSWTADAPRSLAVFLGLSAAVCAASMPWTLATPKGFHARVWTGLGSFVVLGSALVGVSGVDMAFPGSVAALVLFVGYAGFTSGFAAGRLDVPRPARKRFGAGATN